MPSSYNENTVEQAALEWLSQQGYEVVYGPDIAPNTPYAERASFHEVVLVSRLRTALERLNPGAPTEALEEAQRQLLEPLGGNPLGVNRAMHTLLSEGVRLELPDGLGGVKAEHLRVLDFENPGNNSFLAVNQFTVLEGQVERRPDVVLFVNGLPLVLLEFKNTADEKATIEKAYKQLQTYQKQLGRLCAYNALLVISDGTQARIGVLGAAFERFLPWKTVTGREVLPESLGTLIAGALAPAVLLDLVRHFTVFEADGVKLEKKVAAYHQYHAVLKAVEHTVRASATAGDRKGGVVWHTQGSGKSLTMVFYTGKLVVHPALENPTVVVLTDRNDLDDQLFSTFSKCSNLLRQKPEQVQGRSQLREKLGARAAGGVVFTTIQKFLPEEKGDAFEQLSERRNIVVIADEAHRSQYGLRAKMDDQGRIGYGFAKNIRDALPRATFLGFTGTPIETRDADTRAIFGDYIDVYDIARAVEDGATVPIYYEARRVKLELDEEAKASLDQDFEDITENEEVASREKLKSKWAALEALVGAPARIEAVAEDLVAHFEARQDVLEGKGMIVGMSRRICVDLYDALVRLRPEWAGAGDTEGAIKVVMTGDATKEAHWQDHIRSKARNKTIADHFRDPASGLKLVIVRDMWLTGFDVPSLHTMYLDKPMQGAALMQAIARVNRVFRDKPGGLVVDYLGLANSLKEALGIYTQSGGEGEPTRDLEQALEFMLEKLDVVRGMLHGLDYSEFEGSKPTDRVALIVEAQEFILARRDGRMKERFIREVLQLGKAYALAMPHPEAVAVREEMVFLQTVRAALSKQETTRTMQVKHDINAAIQQLVEEAVAPGGVMDVFAAAGLKKPDLSILSEGFLADVQGMKHKNLAVELLDKLLRDEVRTQSRKNVVQSRKFSEKLEAAILRYQSRSIETAQVIEELLDLAREMRAAQARGDEMNLSEDEIAFYDALEVNDSAVQILGDEQLREIARKIAQTVRENATIDWNLREQARANLRRMVKRVLREFGYPPDKQEKASQTVLEQAERLAQNVVEEP